MWGGFPPDSVMIPYKMYSVKGLCDGRTGANRRNSSPEPSKIHWNKLPPLLQSYQKSAIMRFGTNLRTPQEGERRVPRMDRSYRQFYHANVPSGWSNDPNGTIYYHGKAHLFYQHYPHKPEWGTMHWGHFATQDFVRWENLPLTLRPDQDYEVICGCCSGSTIEKDGKLYLMYTAAQPELQRQCMAVSDDGISFTKDPNNPILTADMLDPEVSEMDFRDPRMFRRGDSYYLIAGARIVDTEHGAAPNGGSASHVSHEGEPAVSAGATRSPSFGDVSGTDPEKAGYGNLILLKSSDLYHWSYVGKLFYPQKEYSEEYYRLNGVYECPDYFIALRGPAVQPPKPAPHGVSVPEHPLQPVHAGEAGLRHRPV